MRHRPSRGRIRYRLKTPTCAGLVAVIALLLPAVAEGGLPQPIYFFSNTAQPINKQNPLVIRPKGFLLFQDGQWVLERLHWTGWGSSVARATGVSSSSNDIPNAAEGKRIKTWAHVTLSNPGRFQGHEVYLCFTMTVPPPASDMHLCLGHAHGIYILEPTKQPAPSPAPAPATPSRSEFGAAAAGGGFECNMSYQRDDEKAACVSHTGGEGVLFQQLATLQPNGQIATCSQHGTESRCEIGNLGVVPTFQPGKVVTVGPFTCKVLETGVECTVTATGKGFLMTPESVTEVGG
jgi:hypothetical protein